MKRLIIIVVILAAGVGAGAYYMRRDSGQLQVNTLPISRGQIIDAVGSTGTLQPVTTVTVGSQVSGNIMELHADFNSIVHKDEVLAKLDPTLFEAQLAQSKANLANAQAQLGKDQVTNTYQKVTFDRNTDLFNRGLVTKDALDASKTAYQQGLAQLDVDKAQIQQSTAQVNQNQTNLDHTIITSPIDGIVTQRSVDIGQTVAASMQAPTIFLIAADLTKMQVNANIDESDVGRIRPNQNVTFRVDAYPGREFNGTVVQIRLNPSVVNNVTTYSVIINVPNTDLSLKPGMTANLKVEVAKRDDTLRVPNVALRFRPSNDVFAALNEPVPPEAAGNTRGRGGRPGGGNGGGGNGGANTAANSLSSANPEALPPPSAAGGNAPKASADQTNGVSPNGGTPGNGGGFGRGRGGPGGNGGGFARRNGGGNGDQGGRGQQMDRFKAMTADQQKQFIDRMKSRGQDTTAYEKAMAAAKPSAQPPVAKYGSQSAETIDALFPPLESTETNGRVWMFVDNQLKSIPVRLGITDGNQTELIDGGGIDAGAQVVTGVILPGAARPAAGANGNGNPLLPGGNRGGFPGGNNPPRPPGR